MKKTAFGVFLVLTLTASLFANGGNDGSAEESEVLRVVATTNILADVVSQILGERGELRVLMSAGQNPHSYNPTPRDLAALESADIIFINGLELEEQLLPVIESLDGPVVVEVSHGITPRDAGGGYHDDDDDDDDDEDDDDGEDHHEDEHDHSAGDPHVWFSPIMVMHWVDEIKGALSEVDPANALTYKEAAEAYEAQLKALDQEIRELIDAVPQDERNLVMDHVSLGYFADEYGFIILGNILPSFSDQSEPSAREIATVIETINEYDVQAIFVGGTAPQNVVRMAEAVAAEINRPLPVISLLTGSLTASGRGSDYLDFVRYNTEQIVGVLAE